MTVSWKHGASVSQCPCSSHAKGLGRCAKTDIHREGAGGNHMSRVTEVGSFSNRETNGWS